MLELLEDTLLILPTPNW